MSKWRATFAGERCSLVARRNTCVVVVFGDGTVVCDLGEFLLLHGCFLGIENCGRFVRQCFLVRGRLLVFGGEWGLFAIYAGKSYCYRNRRLDVEVIGYSYFQSFSALIQYLLYFRSFFCFWFWILPLGGVPSLGERASSFSF